MPPFGAAGGYADQMGVDVTVERRIERSRDEVARFAMDPANDTRWILALDSARVLPRGPGGGGPERGPGGSGPGGGGPERGPGGSGPERGPRGGGPEGAPGGSGPGGSGPGGSGPAGSGPGGSGPGGPGADDADEVGLGTRVERIAGFLGRRIEYVNEIEEYDPPRRLAMRSVKAPFPMTVVYEFEEVGDGATLARIRAGGDTRGFYSVAGPLLNQMVKRGIGRDLEALKDLMERKWGGVDAEG